MAVMPYTIPYYQVGRQEFFSIELFFAVAITLWLCSFVFTLSESNEIKPETFTMAARMARGERVDIGVSHLAFIYDRLDAVTNKKSLSYNKFVTLPLPFLSGFLSQYFPKIYNH